MTYGVLSIAVGLLMIWFNKPFARFAMNQQKPFWGFNMTEKDVKITEIFSMIGGTVFCLIGILIVLQVIRLK